MRPVSAWRARAVTLANRLRGRLPYPERCRALIARHAPGQSLVDVGCMWKVDGAYAFHALAHGAVRVTALDVHAPTPEFLAQNAAAGERVRFVQGDINDPAIADAIGVADIVFCSGVLYHMPNPILTLTRLRRICCRTLILGSATIPEQRWPQSAVFFPYLRAGARRALTYPSADQKIGLDTEFVREWDYGNWFWGLTPSSVEAMLRATGFEVLERYPYRRSLCLVCRPG